MSLAVVVTAAAGAVVIVSSTGANAASCSDVDISFARGTGEAAGLGSVGTPFVKALTSALSGKTVSSYAVNYAASLDQSSAGPGGTDMSNHVSSVAASCPNTMFVIGGYSQGASVTDVATGIQSGGTAIPANLASRVSAVVVFGNPLGLSGRTIATASKTYGAKSKDFCNTGDPVCGGGGDVTAHLQYASNGSTTKGAQFAAGLITGSGTGSATPPAQSPTAAAPPATTSPVVTPTAAVPTAAVPTAAVPTAAVPTAAGPTAVAPTAALPPAAVPTATGGGTEAKKMVGAKEDDGKIFGDIDGDGDIDFGDVNLIVQFLRAHRNGGGKVGTTTGLTATTSGDAVGDTEPDGDLVGDIDQDGDVDINDVVTLAKFVLAERKSGAGSQTGTATGSATGGGGFFGRHRTRGGNAAGGGQGSTSTSTSTSSSTGTSSTGGQGTAAGSSANGDSFLALMMPFIQAQQQQQQQQQLPRR